MASEGFKRKLTSIFSADAAGYSRLMGDDEAATVRTLKSYRTLISDLVQQFRGRIIDTPGDNILAEFPSIVDAVNCAVETQQDLAELNLHKEAIEAVTNYLENFPDETIAHLLKLLTTERPDFAKRFEEGLRKAGLPE